MFSSIQLAHEAGVRVLFVCKGARSQWPSLFCSWFRSRRVSWPKAWDLRCLPALVDHDGALERDDDRSILIVAAGLHRHDADMRARPRLALLPNLRLGVDGVALEDRLGKPTPVPSQLAENVPPT